MKIRVGQRNMAFQNKGAPGPACQLREGRFLREQQLQKDEQVLDMEK